MINSVVSTPFDLPVPRLLELPETQEVSLDLPKGLDWRTGYQQYLEFVASLRRNLRRGRITLCSGDASASLGDDGDEPSAPDRG